MLAPNEALCPVCKIIVRSPRDLRVGDRLYCMACMTRIRIVEGNNGLLETETIYYQARLLRARHRGRGPGRGWALLLLWQPRFPPAGSTRRLHVVSGPTPAPNPSEPKR